jgi:hypothetical protein
MKRNAKKNEYYFSKVNKPGKRRDEMLWPYWTNELRKITEKKVLHSSPTNGRRRRK